jgi:hypothetical protein
MMILTVSRAFVSEAGQSPASLFHEIRRLRRHDDLVEARAFVSEDGQSPPSRREIASIHP